MTTQRKQNLLEFIISMLFTYLLFSFISWDFNASHWSSISRALYAIVSPILIIIFIIIGNIKS
jgi:uncharacterized protein YggT (Ycf19 family)